MIIPPLDRPITTDEIIDSIRNCKSDKAPGLDCITNDFKALFVNWISYLVILFNKILESETIPLDWSKA